MDDIKDAFEKELGAEVEFEIISRNEFKKRYEMLFGGGDDQPEEEEADWSSIIPGIEVEP